MFSIVAEDDCKFCEFENLEPTIYDAPESVKSHAIHIVSRMENNASWDKDARRAAIFAGFAGMCK